ncbi:MAG: ABC transporter ATP-binding protein [Solirubrobacterales bacterium]
MDPSSVSAPPDPPGPSGEPVLAVRGLGRSYGARTALAGVGFELGHGERLAIVGPNGAGKTTLLSILAGLQEPDSGEIDPDAREAIGWVPQQAAFYRRLTVEENLRLFARLEDVPDVDAAVEQMLTQTELAPRRGDVAATLSGGNQQRINVALGLLRNPPVLLLDEPCAALDSRQRERLWAFVRARSAGGTAVLFTTHDLYEAERNGHRLLVLADGEALFCGTADELRELASSGGEDRGDFEAAFVRFMHARGH